MGYRILLVDDDPLQIKLSRAVLEKEGHRVISLLNRGGMAASLHDKTFDLALVDVLMPELAGDRLVELIRDYHSGHPAPLVLLSALGAEELADRARQSDADGWVQKPLSVEKVRDLVARHLAGVDESC